MKEKICNRIEEFSNEIEKSDILRVLFERKLNFTGKRMRYSYEQRNEAFKLFEEYMNQKAEIDFTNKPFNLLVEYFK